MSLDLTALRALYPEKKLFEMTSATVWGNEENSEQFLMGCILGGHPKFKEGQWVRTGIIIRIVPTDLNKVTVYETRHAFYAVKDLT